MRLIAKAIIVYSPLLFGFMGIYMAIHMNDARFPWNRELTAFEQGLERRGLLGDASVCILTYIVVLVSSETTVRTVTKIFYSIYLINLWYNGPQALLRLVKEASDNDGELVDDDFLNIGQVESNAATILFVSAVNMFGALLLYFMSDEYNNKAKKE